MVWQVEGDKCATSGATKFDGAKQTWCCVGNRSLKLHNDREIRVELVTWVGCIPRHGVQYSFRSLVLRRRGEIFSFEVLMWQTLPPRRKVLPGVWQETTRGNFLQ